CVVYAVFRLIVDQTRNHAAFQQFSISIHLAVRRVKLDLRLVDIALGGNDSLSRRIYGYLSHIELLLGSRQLVLRGRDLRLLYPDIILRGLKGLELSIRVGLKLIRIKLY